MGAETETGADMCMDRHATPNHHINERNHCNQTRVSGQSCRYTFGEFFAGEGGLFRTFCELAPHDAGFSHDKGTDGWDIACDDDFANVARKVENGVVCLAPSTRRLRPPTQLNLIYKFSA